MTDTAQELAKKYHVDLYGRYPLTITEGKGVYVKATDGREYLDALAGIAVNNLGHCHPNVVKAIRNQAAKLIHISNFYYSEPQSLLVKQLVDLSGLDRAFLCNSGAEAVEGSIKLARKYGFTKGKTGNIISMENCFHGRTLGTIAMGKDKYQKGFGPLPGGYDRVPMNDIEAVNAKVDDDTVGIILEPIQGEGGVHPVDPAYFRRVRELCDRHDAVLIADEIQCGVARTGRMFGYQHYDVLPDIVASAKALGGGFPIGSVIVREKIASAIGHGEHGTTFGGNPLASAAALATLTTLVEEDLAGQAAQKGKYFMEKVRAVAEGWDAIREVRGIGLMIGIELSFSGKPVVQEMMERGILSNCTSDTVIRIVPPLIITREELDRLFEVLVESLKAVEEHAEA